MIKLTSPRISELLDQPETGMGYQPVEVLFDNGTDDGTVSGPKVLPP